MWQKDKRKKAASPIGKSLLEGLPRERITLYVILDRELSKTLSQITWSWEFMAVEIGHESFITGKGLLISDEKAKGRFKTGCHD